MVKPQRAVIELSEYKIWRTIFDSRKGETSLLRLTSWLRRRNIRNLALCTVFILCVSLEIFIFYCLGAKSGDVLVLVLVMLCIFVPIYLPLWYWLLVLAFRPDMCSGMRRLKRLGSLEKFVGEMEEDLSAEGVVYLLKYVCVTKRFIIEASPFYFRVYPLEGLREFDSRKARPKFYYENGTRCKVVTNVPFHMLEPYINPESDVCAETEKPKSALGLKTGKPKLLLGDVLKSLALFVCIIGAPFYMFCFKLSIWGIREAAIACWSVLQVFIVITFISETVSGRMKRDAILGLTLFFCMAGALLCLLYFNMLPVGGVRAAAVYGWCVLLWLFELAAIAVMRQRRLARMLADIKDVGEQIRKMEELYTEGWYNNPVQYLTRLSELYYTNEDNYKALELIREACSIQSGKHEFRIGPEAAMSEVLRLNEIIYLAALGRFDEAEPLLVPFYDKRYKNPVNQYIINAIRADLAINKGDAMEARECLRRVDGLLSRISAEERRISISCHLLLLEAECDLLEKSAASALVKLEGVMARSTWPPHVKRAALLKESIRRKRNSLRRRRHVSRDYQPGQRSARKYASVRRPSHRRAERKR